MTINKKFLKVKRLIENTLPYLGAAIILFTYIGTAAFMTHLLAIRMGGNYLLASTVGGGVAFTRMFIVFQSQMGVDQVTRKFDPGAIMAILLTIYTVVESYTLAPELFVSVTGLIISATIVELIYLSRMNQASRFEVFSSPARMKELKAIYKAEKDFFDMVEAMEDERNSLTPTPQQQNGHALHVPLS